MPRRYCYDGDCGLNKDHLIILIAVETAMDEFGITDIAAALAIVSGANIIPTRAKFRGARPNTSFASLLSRRALRKIKLPPGVRLPTLTGIVPPKVRWTHSIGGFMGRAIPVVGWAYTAGELAVVGYKTLKTYNAIVDDEDRILQ